MSSTIRTAKFTDLLRRLRLMPRRSGSAFDHFHQKCLAACNELGVNNPAHKAYIFATVEHETNGTFKPVREAYWTSEAGLIRWLKKNGKKYWKNRMWGRGHTQNTWASNYKKIDQFFALGGKLIRNPDLMLEDFDLSVATTVAAMKDGWYTGKKLDDYINKHTVDFRHARKIVNGMDKADHIARLAAKYLVILSDLHAKQHTE